jgi:hypothetical protein
MKNFHLPLPDGTYEELRAEAGRTGVPATTIAREALDCWLRAGRKAMRRKAILDYANAAAGTDEDLDPALEAAGAAELIQFDRHSK